MTSTKHAWEQPLETGADSPAGRTDVLSMSPDALRAFLVELGEQPYRARQVFGWLHQRLATSFAEMTDLPAALRARLTEVAELRAPRIDDTRVATDGTRKLQLATADGNVVESVFIPHASGPGKNALCISSQVGCAMGCTFCATASIKLVRHLTAGEIVGQVYAVVRSLQSDGDANAPPPPAAGFDDAADDDDDDAEPVERTPGKRPRPIQNIVFMGMGEPLHNLDAVLAAIRLLTDPAGQGMSPRRITVSTSGLVPQLARLAAESDVHLAVSLNATTDEVRAEIMPVDRRWPIAELLAATRAFPLKPRRRITFEYVLLAGKNDTDDDARRLADLLQGQRAKVNLIPFNPHPLSPFRRPSADRVEAFRRILDARHVATFVRATRGLDIDAACGMLGAKKLEAARGALPVLA